MANQCSSFVVVFFMLSQVLYNVASQRCGNGSDLYSIYQMMLKGHTFKTFKTTPGTLECREACLADFRCQSYNVLMFISICELNNRTRETRPEDFVQDKERYYMAKGSRRVADYCIKHECQNNARCVNGHLNYTCVCNSSGWTGNHYEQECSAPLGMESRHIKDSQITASSQRDGNHAAIQGRLNFKAGGGKKGGWSAHSNNGNQWIQVALGSYTKLTGIATQGRNAHNQWVTAYKLQYSDDGMNFYYYKVPGHSSPKTLEGNKDRDSVVYHKLNPPIQARYIRLRPTAWYFHISLRMELYGCRGSQS